MNRNVNGSKTPKGKQRSSTSKSNFTKGTGVNGSSYSTSKKSRPGSGKASKRYPSNGKDINVTSAVSHRNRRSNKLSLPASEDPTFSPMSKGLSYPKGSEEVINQLVGILYQNGFNGIVEPDPGYKSAAYSSVFIPKELLNGAPFGMKVVVEVVNPQAKSGNFRGKIIEVLGNPESSDVAMLSIIRQYGLSLHFPESVVNEIEHISGVLEEEVIEQELLQGRKDLRHLLSVTIDGEDAKDLDDAISLEDRDGKGYTLWVHIADVSHYVRDNSSLDKEARKRATSVYLVDRVIPMLPAKLSNGLCSLNPEVPRLTMTCEMKINFQGEVTESQIYPSVIQSNNRLSYNQVQKTLQPDFESRIPVSAIGSQDIVNMIFLMKKLTEILILKRQNRGALEFNFPETKIDLDKDGQPIEIYAYPVLYAHKIIEEFMILANETVAETFDTLNIPFVYRIHEAPDEMKIEEFMKVAKIFGAPVKKDKKISAKSLATLMAGIQGKPFTPALEQLLLRSLAKARYFEINEGHFGLASEAYCHFTSPIRRYPDLCIHRIMKAYYEGKNVQKDYKKIVPKVAYHSSEMERNSMEAERATNDQKIVEYMMKHLGDSFEGIISSIFQSGLFVRLNNSVEGMIPFHTLPDYYIFESQRLEAKGERSGKMFRIGQSVTVKVIKVDSILRRLDFELV